MAKRKIITRVVRVVAIKSESRDQRLEDAARRGRAAFARLVA